MPHELNLHVFSLSSHGFSRFRHLSLPPVKLHCSMLAEDAIKVRNRRVSTVSHSHTHFRPLQPTGSLPLAVNDLAPRCMHSVMSSEGPQALPNLVAPLLVRPSLVTALFQLDNENFPFTLHWCSAGRGEGLQVEAGGGQAAGGRDGGGQAGAGAGRYCLKRKPLAAVSEILQAATELLRQVCSRSRLSGGHCLHRHSRVWSREGRGV